MHYLNNGSQVTEKPAAKNRIGSPGFFSESNDNGAPSYPGQDWFNAVIAEFETLMTQSGVTFDPDKFDHLANAIAVHAGNSVFDDLVGLVLPDSLILPMRNKAFIGDGAEYNRADYPKLWNKVKDSSILASQALINGDPETHAAKYGDGDGVTTFTVPNYGLRPHLASAGLFGAVGSTAEDMIQNITGAFQIQLGDDGAYLGIQSASGAFRNDTTQPPASSLNHYEVSNEVNNRSLFDASLIARTGTYTEVNSSFLNFYIIHGEAA
ncbi:hypothetical protein AB4189_08040 [Vibrio sp. 10N.286.49.E1]|uniref:hypothetical protein n=1 Tax=Vibrio sp. 10N.286.49.E1 TaxID=3229702 RepID=UPI00354DE0A1